MRKIISCFITLTILLGLFCAPFSVAAETMPSDVELDEAESTLIGLGIIDRADYNPDALLSRAEFASLISSLCDFVPSNKHYLDNMDVIFGEDNSDKLITSADEQVFDDVDSTMEEFEAINAVYEKGYMRGITPTHFGPYYDITAGEVVKVIVSMLGRDQLAQYKGGYPNGYMTVARDIKLTAGISVSSSDFITLRQTLNLIYNAFDINVYELTGVGTDGESTYTQSDKTFLNYCADVYKAEGIMTDNGITTLYGASAVGEDAVVIGGMRMYIADSYSARDYIGRQLVAYYSKTDSDKKYLEYAAPTDNDTAVTFDADDFAGYTSTQMKYYDENGKLVKASLSNPKVICNNTVLNRYNASTFSFLFGDITLASTGASSAYDIIIVNNYNVGKIAKANKADKIIYSDTVYGNMSDIKTLELKEQSGKVITITDANGASLDFDALLPGSIISVARSTNGNYIKIIVSTSTVEGFVVTDYALTDSMEISNGTDTYTIKGEALLSANSNIRIGEAYDLGFDYEGNLVWFISQKEAGTADAAASTLKKAFLIDSDDPSNGLSISYVVKLFNDSGELAIYELDKKVILNHSSVTAPNAMTEIANAEGKIVLYRLDKDTNLLKEIVTPLAFGDADTDNRGWYAVNPYVKLSAESDSDADKAAYDSYLTAHACNKYLYQSNGGQLDKSMIYDKNATLFAVPGVETEYDDEKKFHVNAVKFINNKSYYINAYDTDRNALAPMVFAFSSGGGSVSGDAVSARTSFLITKVMKTLNSDEEETNTFKGYLMDFDKKTATETTLAVSTGVEFVDSDNNTGAAAVQLEPGDIIRYATNSDGEISAVFVAYDKNLGVAYPFGTPSADWYDADSYAGYAYTANDSYVRLTSAEPHEVAQKAYDKWIADGNSATDYDAALAEFNYITDRANAVVHTVGKVVLVVEETRNGITVRNGSFEDIVSYEESGTPASGRYSKIVGTETSWGHTIGTVIYK